MEANPNISSGEAAPASQLLEIINEDTLNAPERTEELETRDVWSVVEMGDDSVFYSDEEQAHQDRGAAVCGFSFSAERKHLVNSVTDYKTDQQKENSPREENSYRGISGREEANTKLQNKTTHGRSVAESKVSPEKFGRICEEFLSPDFTALNTKTQYGLNEPTAKAKQQVREKGVMEEAERSHPGLDETCTKMENTDDPKEQLQKPDKQFEDLESKCNFKVTAELPQDPDHSTLEESNESACSAFNHLSSSKFSTVSYRRIQRGNTRQKIEEFEIMLKNQS